MRTTGFESYTILQFSFRKLVLESDERAVGAAVQEGQVHNRTSERWP